MTKTFDQKSKLKLPLLGFVSALAISTMGITAPAVAQSETTEPSIDIDMAAQSLQEAINLIASRSGVQIALYSDDAEGIFAPALQGDYTVEQALDTVLKGTGLVYERVNARTIAIAPPERLSSSLRNETTSVTVPVNVQTTSAPSTTETPAPAPTEEAAAIVDTPNVLDTIIVRARKRDESIFDIPGVVNVLSADQLRANGTTDAQSLALNNLGVVYSVTFAGSSAPRITIRGVGDDDFNPNGSSSAAVHVNGVYQGTNGLLNNQYFDIEQVEILKGPQGTLYGRNATAGAINIMTVRPGDEYGGYLDFDAGNFGVVRSEGAVNLPVSNGFRLRLAGLFERSDGFYEHSGTGPVSGFSYDPGVIAAQDSVPAQGDWGGADRAFGRVTAEVDLTEATLMTLRAMIGQDKSELPLPDVTPELWAEYEARAFFINPEAPAFVAYENALDNDPFSSITNALPKQDADQFGANVELVHSFENALTATVLVGHETLHRDYATTDNLPVSAADYLWKNEFEQTTLEARLAHDNADGLGWLVGAFFLKDEVDFDTTLLFRNTGLWQTDIQTDYVQERTSIGVFASGDWTPVDWFTLEAGIRYSSDEVTFEGQTTNLDPFGTFGPAPTFFPLGSVFIGPPISPEAPLVFDEDLDNDDVTWKLSGLFRPMDGLSLYGTVSTGYKAGGFDGSTILSPQEALPIEPETVLAFEAGAKYQSPENRFFAEANLFHYDFEDYQSTAKLNVGGFDTNVRANVSDALIQGAEFSATLVPIEGLSLNAGVAFLETEIENFRGVQENIEGNDLPFSPDASWNASATYKFPVSNAYTINTQFDVSGTGSHFQTINNNDEVDSYTVSNARLGLETENWELALWVRNLTDETYDVGFFPGGGLTPDTKFKGSPRTYGLSVNLDF